MHPHHLATPEKNVPEHHSPTAPESLMYAEVSLAFESRRFVKEASRFSDQLVDTSRTTTLTYIADATEDLRTDVDMKHYEQQRQTTTEYEALHNLDQFLDTAYQHFGSLDTSLSRRTLMDMFEDLTFIGEKEYKEAALGIAEYWKQRLRDDPTKNLFIVTGYTSKSSSYKTESGAKRIKSDEHLLENILYHFDESDMQEFGRRLHITPSTIETAENLSTVLLDDWTISGGQLLDTANAIAREHPELAQDMEVQLITASHRYLHHGVSSKSLPFTIENREPIPVKAYFAAHSVKNRAGAIITGSKSSVDFDFSETCAKIVDAAEASDDLDDDTRKILGTMPNLTTIVRPYY